MMKSKKALFGEGEGDAGDGAGGFPFGMLEEKWALLFVITPVRVVIMHKVRGCADAL